MWKLFAFSLLVALSSVPLGLQQIPTTFAGFLRMSEAGKKTLAKPINAGDCPLISVLHLSIVNLRSTRRQARGKNCSGCPLARPSSAFGYAQAIDETWSDYKKARGDDSPSEIIWVMRLILLVGITIPVIVVLDCLRATRTACISPITVATVAMLEAHGRSPRPSRATQKASRQAAIYKRQLRKCRI